MKKSLSAWLSGFIFSLGLVISGMADPRKVIGFLDIFGKWNPSLMFVMIGALAAHSLTSRWIRRRQAPVFEPNWHIPQNSSVTKSLVVGAAIFGVGWALAGYCPGPALVSLGFFQPRAFIFLFGMALGMFLFKILDRRVGFRR